MRGWVGRHFPFWPFAVIGVLLFLGNAAAQDPSAREQQLLDLINRLQERVDQLESTVESLKSSAPAASPTLDDRVERLESALDESATKEKSDLHVKWKDSLRIESEDGKIKLRLGVRLHSDFAWYDDGDGLGLLRDPDSETIFRNNEQDGVEFRRARIYLSGSLYDSVEFKTEYDFAGGSAGFSDVYLAYVDPPLVDKITIGRFKEPFSLNELTSDNDIAFLERALPNVFAPGRNTGIAISDTAFNKRMTWAVGVFRDTDGFGNGARDGNYNYSARITGIPWYDEDRGGVFHLGASASVRNPDAFMRYRARAETHVTPIRFLNTGNFFADDIALWGAESAFSYGPFTLQGEYIRSDVDTRLIGDKSFSGYYVEAAYVVTGEHRPYDTSSGIFKGIKPAHNFSWRGEERAWGAWELALRYSSLDLNDGFIRGGEERNITAGVKWYLNPQTRVMLEYVHGNVDHDLYGGDVDILQARFQFYF